MTKVWWVVGVCLIGAGVVAGLYQNPFGFDGHSDVTCGAAFLIKGYAPKHILEGGASLFDGSNPQCPARRLQMGILAVCLMVGGVGVIFMGSLAKRRARSTPL